MVQLTATEKSSSRDGVSASNSIITLSKFDVSVFFSLDFDHQIVSAWTRGWWQWGESGDGVKMCAKMCGHRLWMTP